MKVKEVAMWVMKPEGKKPYLNVKLTMDNDEIIYTKAFKNDNKKESKHPDYQYKEKIETVPTTFADEVINATPITMNEVLNLKAKEVKPEPPLDDEMPF